MVAMEANPDTLAGLQNNIVATGSMLAQYQLTPIQYPIVFRENGDWAQYVDEYKSNPFPPPDTLPASPGIAIINQTGRFYAIRSGSFDTHAGIDWVVKKVDELLGGRQPVDTILALDRSNTMNDLPPLGGQDPKIAILKDAVGVFLDVWETHAVPGDRVGVVDFSDTVRQYSQPSTGAHLVPVATDTSAVHSYVDSLVADGWTCMGGAVAESLDALAASGRRHIILFSDGMQNYNPVLVDVNVLQIQILRVDPANVGEYKLITGIYGDSGVPGKPGQNLADFGTHIHTIGVGLEGQPWSELMSSVAWQTDALYFQTPAPAADLQNFFINDLLESFKGATLQLVQHTLGTYDRTAGYAQDSCWINRTARWLTVVLSWQGNPDHNQLVCNLEAPDGTLIELQSRIKAAPRYRVISMPLPPFHHDRLINHVGQWKLHIMGTTRGAVTYQVFWTVDDRHVHFEIPRVERLYHVRDDYLLWGQLLEDGEPIPASRIQQSTVRVASPVVNLEQFLREYKIAPARLRRLRREAKELKLTSEEEVKLYALSQDKEAVAQCAQQRIQSIPMNFQDGKLTSSVNFTIPGIHRFDLHVSALDRQGSRIVRTRTLNILVNPAQA